MQYWVVKLEAAAFDTEAEARAFQEALEKAFMQMPEAEGIAATVGREHVLEGKLSKPIKEMTRAEFYAWLDGGE